MAYSGTTGSAAGRMSLLVDRVSELVQTRAERFQEALDGKPLDASPAALDARDVGGIHAEAAGKLLLRDTGVIAERSQRAAEHDQFGVSVGVVHRSSGLGILGQVVVACAQRKIVGARGGCTPGRRGTESLNSRHASHATSDGARLPCQSSPPGASNHKEEPMSIRTNEMAAEVFQTVLRGDGSRCPRPELERRFRHIAPLTLDEAIATLVADGGLIEDDDTLRTPVAKDEASVVELLAAVVNHVLIASPPPVTFEQVCEEVERDPAVVKEHREVLLALALIEHCALATRDEEGRWRPTRAAIWAERLSF
jgi:hypothetical protein